MKKLLLSFLLAGAALGAPGDITGWFQKDGSNNAKPVTIAGIVSGEAIIFNGSLVPVSRPLVIGDTTGYGTGIATALATNVGSAGAPVLFNGALGTPSSGALPASMVSAGTFGTGAYVMDTALRIGAQTALSTATPVTLSLGGTYSSTAGANPKLKLFDNASTVYGFGVSAAQIDYIAGAGVTHAFWVDTTKALAVSGTSATFTVPVASPGTITGGDAAAGNIGEYVSASVVQGSATALTTATPKTVTSISLTAGDWDITAIGSITGASTGTVFDVAVGGTTNSLAATILGDTRCQTPTVSLTGADATLMVPAVRVTINATTTYYLIVQEIFTIGTPAAYGRISARRVR